MVYARLAILSLRALQMAIIAFLLMACFGCAGFKDTARDAAAEALREVTPMLRETGKELADHAANRFREAGGQLIANAKGDIGGALASIPGLAKDAGAKAAADAIAARVSVEDPAKAAEFQRRVEADGLPAALEWLFGGGGLVITAGLARLWWRTRGALKATVQGIETAPPEVAARAKQAVAAHGGVAFDKEIQSALS